MRLLESFEKVMCWPVHCLVYNAADSCENHHERVTQFWTSSSEEDVEERKIKRFDPLSLALLRLFSPLGKLVRDERYILKAYRFESLRDFLVYHILCADATSTHT